MNFLITVSIHGPFKNTNCRCPIPADPSPNMNLYWMFGPACENGSKLLVLHDRPGMHTDVPRLVLWSLALLSATESPVCFQLDRSFICPDVLEFISNNLILIHVLERPIQPFCFVRFANKLAITTPAKCPAKLRSTT